jgi:phosphoenolpyruvate carboxykinase (GTP)
MAMKPFCGYNFGDYWQHWLSFETKAKKLPRVFHVNWFRQDKNGKFMWPGYGENLRVLQWIAERCQGNAAAVETPIGFLPRPEDLDVAGLGLDSTTLQTLLSIDASTWRQEIESIGKYLDDFKDRVPVQLRDQQRAVAERLGS